MTPPLLQIAFQGGGARFVEMLPIAHALADAHRDQTIRLTRVAGSSAGAICAALIACKADFSEARNFIQNEGPKRARAMKRWSIAFGEGEFTSVTDRIRVAAALYQAKQGIPLFRRDLLVTFFDDLFSASAKESARLIEDISGQAGGIKLAITGSDLARSQGALFETGNLIDIIANSSAIPFAFRTFADMGASPYVDGGVCENLPVERLLASEDADGPILCVSIVEEENAKYIPASAKEYCVQLISASMNHNVERAKRLVGKSNVIEAKTKLKTFDFEGAIEKLRSGSFYKDAYETALDRISEFAELYWNVPAPQSCNLSGRVSAPKIMRSLQKVFETSFNQKDWGYEKAAFVVRAEGLHKLERQNKADHIIRIATITAKGDNLVCFNSSARLDTEGSILPTTWTCHNDTQDRDLAVQAIPVQDEDGVANGKMLDVLVFFEDPKTSIARGDVITIKSHYLFKGGLSGLVLSSDFISISNPHPNEVGIADIVLAYPSNLGAISVANDAARGIQNAIVMTKQMLTAYSSDASIGYSFVGLRTEKLQPKQGFRAIFTRSS